MALTEIARLLPWLALHRLARYPLSLISTLQKGHLYFAKQGTFLFCIDRKKLRLGYSRKRNNWINILKIGPK